MAVSRVFIASLLLSFFVATCYGIVSLSTLPKTLIVTSTTSAKPGEVLKSGEDTITVTWSFNQTAGTDSGYKTVKVKLCYAPISQMDRAWRKTVDNLAKDKTCQFKIVNRPYTPSNNSFTWTIERSTPSATYFIRAYAFNSDGVQVGFGQTTDGKKTTHLFEIQAISGRHVSLDIASICFSSFSILSLAGFFYIEKRKARISAQQK